MHKPEDPQKRTSRLRRKRSENPGWSTGKNVKWNMANPEKRLAHKRVEYAIKTGKLHRSGCERCGSLQVHAHHDDYAKPLEVIWLCNIHHRERHRELMVKYTCDSALVMI